MNELPRWTAPPDSPRWIGLDVGGANLKASDGRDRSLSQPFELWKRPGELAGALAALLDRFPAEPTAGVALTMTGELADCYETKSDGVRAIVAATVAASAGLSVRVATADGRWLSTAAAVAAPMAVAAANWRVAADLVARAAPAGTGLWIDCGSTTTDVIPIADGAVVAKGLTDPARLLAGELVYTGVRRTPVCAVVRTLPYRGAECPVAAEWFATTADAWLWLGEVPEDPDRLDTADGRPLTRAAGRARLARCVCADRESFSDADACAAAERVAQAQVDAVTAALEGRRAEWAVVGGEGGFLARRALGKALPEVRVLSLTEVVGPDASRAFPAHAAAVLAAVGGKDL